MMNVESDGSFMITDPTNESSFLDIVAVNEAGEELETISASNKFEQLYRQNLD